jgi:hypothetical protein
VFLFSCRFSDKYQAAAIAASVGGLHSLLSSPIIE